MTAWGLSQPTRGQETAVATPAADIETALPQGRDILAKHVEAVGGADKIRSLKATHIKGEFQMPAFDLKAPLTIWLARPQNARFEMEIPGMGKVIKGTNGEIGWEVSDITGPRILEGVELSQFLREADGLADLHPEKYFKSIECRGTEEVDGKMCYVVELTSKNEEESVETRYYDKETYLLVKNKQVQRTNMGDLAAETHISDYRDLNGMKVAHRIEVNVMDQQQVLSMQEFEFNPDMADGTFDTPEAIQELLTADEESPEEQAQE